MCGNRNSNRSMRKHSLLPGSKKFYTCMLKLEDNIMKIILTFFTKVLLTFSLCLISLATAAEKSASVPDFASVSPFALSAEQGEELTRKVYRAIRNRDSSISLSFEDIAAGRAIFVSYSDGADRARVVLGLGRGLHEAAQRALKQIWEKNEGLEEVRHVKIDMVQYVYRSQSLNVNSSSLPLPSLIGLAFTPTAEIALLPEQIIAQSLVSAGRLIDVHAVGKLYIDNKEYEKLGLWNGLSLKVGAQPAHFFESQSFFFDGNTFHKLFRGHRLFKRPTPEVLLKAATSVGDFLLQHITDKGTFDFSSIPEWQYDLLGNDPLRDHAETVLALLDLAEKSQQSRFRDSAERVAQFLLSQLRPYADGKAACIVEAFRPAEFADPLQRASLDATALTALALLELRELEDDKRYDRELGAMTRYILMQLQADGNFVPERRYPEGQLSTETSISASSMAIVVLLKMYEITSKPPLLEAADKAMKTLLDTYVRNREMSGLPSSEWLVKAILTYSNYSRDRDLVTQAERISLGILTEQTLESRFPDMIGAYQNHPSATQVAHRTQALAAAAEFLQKSGQDLAAVKLMSHVNGNVVFQLQAQMDSAASLYLVQPQKYYGAFRDHLLAYGFALHCQHANLISLLDTLQAMQLLKLSNFPENERLESALEDSRDLIDSFPRYLPSTVSEKAAFDSMLLQ